MDRAFSEPGLAELRAKMARVVVDGVPGLAWAIGRGHEVHEGAMGVRSLATGEAVDVDSIFRIASLTKPITAVAALSAIEDGMFALDDPVETWLPELAEPRVLRRQAGPLTDTVAADRSITVRDLLACTAGYGFDFAHFHEQAQVAELVRLGLGVGPPAPATVPAIDEWMSRLATVALDHQPGAAWRYHFGSEILGVLLQRALASPLERVLADRVLGPLGMVDTGFHVPPDRLTRFTAAYVIDGESGGRRVYDEPDGQWSAPPPFPSGGGGLASTVADMLAFGRALSSGGANVLSERSVAAMTTDQLATMGVSIAVDDDIGWGYGVDVRRASGSDGRSPGSYGWVGGLGAVWWNDPSHDLTAVLFTNLSVDGPQGAAFIDTFRDAVYGALR